MTTTFRRRTELAHGSSDGIDVYRLWNEPTSRVTVGVVDARTDDSFAELEVDGHYALDAFNHPYAHAARPDAADVGALIDDLAARPDSGGDSQDAPINPRRTDHARTDR